MAKKKLVWEISSHRIWYNMRENALISLSCMTCCVDYYGQNSNIKSFPSQKRHFLNSFSHLGKELAKSVFSISKCCMNKIKTSILACYPRSFSCLFFSFDFILPFYFSQLSLRNSISFFIFFCKFF